MGFEPTNGLDPGTLYDKPDNQFVASFIGSPQMNYLDATIKESEGEIIITYQGGSVKLNPEQSNRLKESGYKNSEVVFGIRPEHIIIKDSADATENIAMVEVAELLGAETNLFLNMGGETFIAKTDPALGIKVKDKVKVQFVPDKLHLFDKETEKALLNG